MKKIKIILSALIAFTFFYSLSAESFFSGYAGGKFNYSGKDESSTEYSPNLNMQAFFSSQINFSQNIWSHIEFSLNTENLISQDIFHHTASEFSIDELSVIYRNQSDVSSNYLSLFMGTYDPIGSDIFLQRYFGAEPIASKITDNWMGLAGSILYPHFGIGGAEVVKFTNAPLAAGFYLYVNHEDENYYVFNGDARFACTFRYFTADIAAGIGIPYINTDPQYQGAWMETNFHMGTTMLIGNNYTTSLFIQAGIYNLSSSKITGNTINPSETYILIEPRFVLKQTHLNVSFFSLPKDTVKNFMYIHDTFGVSSNFYNSSFTIGHKTFTSGINAAAALPDKSFINLFKSASQIMDDGICFTLTPYLSTEVFKGELHTQVQIQTGTIKFGSMPDSADISVDIGYKTVF